MQEVKYIVESWREKETLDNFHFNCLGTWKCEFRLERSRAKISRTQDDAGM